MTAPLPRGRWTLEDGVRVTLDRVLHLTFQRTRRLKPGDGNAAAPSYGVAPLAGATAGSRADILIPVREEEAIWVGLSAVSDASPFAVRVVVREPTLADAVTGEPPVDELSSDPQNYVVVPPQYAIAGIAAGSGLARQLVRDSHSDRDAPCQLLELTIHTATRRIRSKGRRPTPVVLHDREKEDGSPGVESPDSTGFVLQRIAADPHGITTWSPRATASILAELVAPELYTRETGQPPPAPLDERTRYHGRRFP